MFLYAEYVIEQCLLVFVICIDMLG